MTRESGNSQPISNSSCYRIWYILKHNIFIKYKFGTIVYQNHGTTIYVCTILNVVASQIHIYGRHKVYVIVHKVLLFIVYSHIYWWSPDFIIHRFLMISWTHTSKGARNDHCRYNQCYFPDCMNNIVSIITFTYSNTVFLQTY